MTPISSDVNAIQSIIMQIDIFIAALTVLLIAVIQSLEMKTKQSKFIILFEFKIEQKLILSLNAIFFVHS